MSLPPREILPRRCTRKVLLTLMTSGLALFCSYLWVMQPPAPDVIVRSPEQLDWGETVGGLQMAACSQSNRTFVQCWLRNATTNRIAYNRYFLGYFENIRVEVHTDDGWVELPRLRLWTRCVKGVGAGTRDMAQLDPLQVVPYGDDLRSEFASKYGGTFGLYLGEFDWPEVVLKSPGCEIRVKQTLRGPGHETPITIVSPGFRIEGMQSLRRLPVRRKLLPYRY